MCAPGGVCSGGGCLLQGVSAPEGGGCMVSQHALRENPPPPLTESQMPVKTLPCPNFIAGGNKRRGGAGGSGADDGGRVEAGTVAVGAGRSSV